MKKLNVNELNVIVSVIIEKINEIKYEKIKGKVEKDVDYKKIEKSYKELEELNKNVREKNSEISELNKGESTTP